MPIIRPALPADVLGLPAIEAAAGEAFRTVGMPEIADDPLPDVQQLKRHASDGRVRVATVSNEVVGYALAVVRDGSAHLEQVSVHPDHAGQRIGADLIDAVTSWARDRGDDRLTLTTFADVPWNAPYYRKLGFRALPDDALGPQLAAELSAERMRFTAPRIAMARDV
ncbi:GNAT family N-acetyltransferase [Kocuria rhizophila]|uniref:GNAT family N-acetyltransferase n=1 Tax=Kocuria TaxID=57493 RepID=UPI000750131F|nr:MULTISPECIES: GNAT family N-acetyltransferase [Kocuria]KUP27146.1 acetyltransferase [Kocuria rhizophila]MDN3226044.1 GNAT family N-acetyltransferase [Kocuria rhizophila]OFK05750.1 acetyltransferase [Kocuria sp. HMSC066H03]PKZ37911.1 N-acetyltransferase [Kocuria rhizophila]